MAITAAAGSTPDEPERIFAFPAERRALSARGFLLVALSPSPPALIAALSRSRVHVTLLSSNGHLGGVSIKMPVRGTSYQCFQTSMCPECVPTMEWLRAFPSRDADNAQLTIDAHAM